MKQEFFVKDIIEILNITSYQRWDLGYELADNIIGMRFKIIKVSEWTNGVVKYYISTETTRGVVGNKSIEPCFEATQLMLYHRPFKNFVKVLLKWVKNLCSQL